MTAHVPGVEPESDLSGIEPELGLLASRVVVAYRQIGRTVGTAESLTGGLLGATITGVPGASLIYRGGVITYATDIKASLGGVDPRVLQREGAVSEETARALARQAAHAVEADVAVALTGVAGPDPQEDHPVGTVWLGWYADGAASARRFQLTGDRDRIRRAAVRVALTRLLDLACAAQE